MQRRTFMKSAAIGMAATTSPAFSYIPDLAGDKIRVGVIGCNGMGWSDIKSLMKIANVECIAICDVDSNVVARR